MASFLYLLITFLEPNHRKEIYDLEGKHLGLLNIEGIIVFLYLVDFIMDSVHRYHQYKPHFIKKIISNFKFLLKIIFILLILSDYLLCLSVSTR
jgi:hypothetical protein